MNEKLIRILNEARINPKLKQALIDTRSAKDPMDAFCNTITSFGFQMTIGEIFEIGEEYTSNLLKSCNGGAVYPIEGWDDWYEDFFISLSYK